MSQGNELIDPEQGNLLERAEVSTDSDRDSVWIYFQQMGAYSLLSREEEVLLAKEMETGKAACLWRPYERSARRFAPGINGTRRLRTG